MQIKVVIDNREKYSRRQNVKEIFKLLKDTEVVEDTLSLCDYLVYKDNNILFGVEWKTYEDYVSSIMNNHLKSQLTDMEECKFPTYLIVTGYSYKTWRMKHKDIVNVSKEQIDGFTTSIAGRFKTKLICYEAEDNGIDALLKLTTLHMDDKPLVGIQLPERKKSTGNPQLDMYLSIPSIGPKKAQSYAEKMSFFEFLFNCKTVHASRKMFKDNFGIAVTESVIDYCKKL